MNGRRPRAANARLPRNPKSGEEESVQIQKKLFRARMGVRRGWGTQLKAKRPKSDGYHIQNLPQSRKKLPKKALFDRSRFLHCDGRHSRHSWTLAMNPGSSDIRRSISTRSIRQFTLRCNLVTEIQSRRDLAPQNAAARPWDPRTPQLGRVMLGAPFERLLLITEMFLEPGFSVNR